MNTNRIILPLLIFVFMVAILLLAGEAFYSDQPAVWQPVVPSTGTPVPQTARTQWWVEIKTPTPKPTMTMTVTPTVTEAKTK